MRVVEHVERRLALLPREALDDVGARRTRPADPGRSAQAGSAAGLRGDSARHPRRSQTRVSPAGPARSGTPRCGRRSASPRCRPAPLRTSDPIRARRRAPAGSGARWDAADSPLASGGFDRHEPAETRPDQHHIRRAAARRSCASSCCSIRVTVSVANAG